MRRGGGEDAVIVRPPREDSYRRGPPRYLGGRRPPNNEFRRPPDHPSSLQGAVWSHGGVGGSGARRLPVPELRSRTRIHRTRQPDLVWEPRSGPVRSSRDSRDRLIERKRCGLSPTNRKNFNQVSGVCVCTDH